MLREEREADPEEGRGREREEGTDRREERGQWGRVPTSEHRGGREREGRQLRMLSRPCNAALRPPLTQFHRPGPADGLWSWGGRLTPQRNLGNLGLVVPRGPVQLSGGRGLCLPRPITLSSCRGAPGHKEPRRP